ncbi:hypothetical protein RB196_13135 [Streptomyces sp. PmtA]|uniref:hypothetical protein n=1 Tax=Streptomyces sp. PmtA TaxID=3074275 RepID=UPI0030158592
MGGIGNEPDHGPSARGLTSTNQRAWVTSAQLPGLIGLHHGIRCRVSAPSTVPVLPLVPRGPTTTPRVRSTDTGRCFLPTPMARFTSRGNPGPVAFLQQPNVPVGEFSDRNGCTVCDPALYW